MGKYKKFTLTSSGRVVYRENGNLYRGKHTIKGNRVYGANGRLIGYLGKASKTQQRTIDKKDKARVKRDERKARKQWLGVGGTDDLIGDYGASTKDNGWRATAIGKRAWYEIPTRERPEVISIEQRGIMNFASMLQQCVDAGLYTVEQANDMYQEYIDATAEERSEIWEKLDDDCSEQGYKPSSPPNENFDSYYGW